MQVRKITQLPGKEIQVMKVYRKNNKPAIAYTYLLLSD